MFDRIKQVSIGYAKFLEEIASFRSELEPDYNSPYNIVMKDGNYQVQVFIPGFKEDSVHVEFTDGMLTISADPAEVQQDYVYTSVFAQPINLKLCVSRDQDVSAVHIEDGVLYVDFVSLLPPRRNRVIMVGKVQPAPEVPAVDIPVEAPAVTEVVNADVNTAPTVEVKMPETLPQVAEVTEVTVADTIDHANAEPQVSLTLSDATGEVANTAPVDMVVVPTPSDDHANMVVAIDSDVKAKLDEAGVDVAAAVQAAVEQAATAEKIDLPADTTPVVEAVADPEAATDVTVAANTDLTVTVPDTVGTVMEVKKADDGSFELAPVDTTAMDANNYASIVPVVTGDASPDIVVAVPQEFHDALPAETKVDEVLSAVVKEADPVVVTTADTVPLDSGAASSDSSEASSEAPAEPVADATPADAAVDAPAETPAAAEVAVDAPAEAVPAEAPAEAPAEPTVAEAPAEPVANTDPAPSA